MTPVSVFRGAIVAFLALACARAINAAPAVGNAPTGQPPARNVQEATIRRLPVSVTQVPEDLGEVMTPGAGMERPAAMTVDDFLQLAFTNHPSLLRARAEISAACGRWLQAGLPPNPRVGYLGSEIGNEGAAGQQGGFVGQLFVTGGKLELARNVVSREVAVRRQQYRAEEMRVINDVRIAYIRAVVAERRKSLSGELLGIARKAAASVETGFRYGETSQLDLVQAQMEAGLAENRLAQAAAEATSAWRQLAAASAVPELVPQRLDDRLDTLPATKDYHAALAQILAESPQLAAAWTEVNRSRWALARARAEPTPNVNVQGSVQFDDATNDTVAGLQIGLPLPIRNRNPGGIRAAAAKVTSAQAGARRLELALSQQLAETFAQYEGALQQVQRFNESILPAAEAARRIIVRDENPNAPADVPVLDVSYLRLLAAQQAYFRARLDYIEALRNLHEAAVSIDGLLVSASLGPAPVGEAPAEYPAGIPTQPTYSTGW